MGYIQTQSPEPDHLIFLHISKTGGTTLGVPLRLIYGYRHSLQVGGEDQLQYFQRLPENKQRNIRLLKGHIPFGFHEHCPGTAKYVTLLREPVSRIDSFHRMLLAEYTREQFSIEHLEDYINSGHKTYRPNSQIRAVTGTPASEPVGAQTLERAKEILDEHFLVAGTTDLFDASIVLMKERLEWSLYPFYVRSRVGSPKQKRPIPDHVKTQIQEDNHWDVQLYRYVRDQLTADIKRGGPDFQDHLQRFQRWNRIFASLAYRPLRWFRTVREAGKQAGLFSSRW